MYHLCTEIPGLYISERSGLLEYDPQYKGGIVVGTRTTHVPGKTWWTRPGRCWSPRRMTRAEEVSELEKNALLKDGKMCSTVENC